MTLKNLKEKLDNPITLVVQGFVVGLIFFWATLPHEARAEVPVAAEQTQSVAG